MASDTIGFIGLGIMGAPMATHLLRAGHKMVVYNRTPSKMEPLVAMGAQAGRSCTDVAERSEGIISMVGDSSDVECVYTGDTGVLNGAKPGELNQVFEEPVSISLNIETAKKNDICRELMSLRLHMIFHNDKN